MSFFISFCLFIFERERERARAQVGEGQRERGTEDPKQEVGSMLTAASSPMKGLNSQTESRDHGLS